MPKEPSSIKFDAVAGSVVLGRYRIIQPLGRGGTGVVYLGRTEGAAGFSKPVVIKRLLPNFVRDPQHAQMLVREARILSTLKHVGIVGVVDLGEEDDAYVMVLEYVHGYDLGHWLKFLRGKARRLPIDVALEIAVRVLEALHYAHTQKKPDGSPGGVIHRDISPSNILLDLDGSVRILDFGIAQVTDELADADTKRNLFKGKIGYSHPSLLKLGTPSAITDTYSAAVVVLQMLIGVNPFYAESTAATMERVINMPLPKLRDFRSDASTELERILLRALSRDLTEAFPSALALAEALKTQRNNDASHAANQLNEMVQSDFVGEMPQVLQLERLDERDAAWRSFAGGQDEGLQRMSRAPDSGEPTAIARPMPRGRSLDALPHVQATSEDATVVGPLTTSKTAVARGRSLVGIGIGGVVVALLGVVIVLLLRGNEAKPEPRYLVVSGGTVPSGDAMASVLPVVSTAVSTNPDVPAPSVAGSSVRESAGSGKGSTPSVTGPREPTSQYLTQVFARRQSQIQSCFAHAKPDQTNLTLQVSFEVDASGKVTNATVSPSGGTALGSCLLVVARATRFGALTQSANFRIPVRASIR
jgi:eukaryotic-like serine/threonine-protein kinase